jgi:hypothetical protein
MYQPRELFELTRAKKSDSGSLKRNGEHISIIKDARYLRAFGPGAERNILTERQHDVRYDVRIPLDGYIKLT